MFIQKRETTNRGPGKRYRAHIIPVLDRLAVRSMISSRCVPHSCEAGYSLAAQQRDRLPPRPLSTTPLEQTAAVVIARDYDTADGERNTGSDDEVGTAAGRGCGPRTRREPPLVDQVPRCPDNPLRQLDSTEKATCTNINNGSQSGT